MSLTIDGTAIPRRVEAEGAAAVEAYLAGAYPIPSAVVALGADYMSQYLAGDAEEPTTEPQDPQE
jgi:hypothetical protein